MARSSSAVLTTEPPRLTFSSPARLGRVGELVGVIQRLSLARSLSEIQAVVRTAARSLTGADGASFVLRDGDQCYYADEDSISPLWKGKRFPLHSCVSGWVMVSRHPAVIEDIYEDDRVPHQAYRRTFVKSLVMVPIRQLDPVGAIGNYWARRHHATAQELELLQALADSAALAMENVRFYRELEDSRLDTLQKLARTAEYRDDATYQHTERVGRTAYLLAQALGLDASDASLIRQAAQLHDLGKLAIPDAILRKPGNLTAAEFEHIKRHPAAGAAILSGSTSEVLQLAEEIALTHHECWDGSGYPSGLEGEATPLGGRIVALADVFDALTHARPYKQPWPIDSAVAEIRRLGGRQFEPAMVNAFLELDPNQLVELPGTAASDRSGRPISLARRPRRSPRRDRCP